MKWNRIDYIMLILLIMMAGVILVSMSYVDFNCDPFTSHPHTPV